MKGSFWFRAEFLALVLLIGLVLALAAPLVLADDHDDGSRCHELAAVDASIRTQPFAKRCTSAPSQRRADSVRSVHG